MNLPSVFATFESLVSIKEQGGFFYFSLAQSRGWTAEHPSGLLVAAAVECDEPDDDWFEQVTLWLASTPAALDDSLHVADDGIWLVRRHMPTIEAVELEASLSQLFSVAQWFATSRQQPCDAGAHSLSEHLA